MAADRHDPPLRIERISIRVLYLGATIAALAAASNEWDEQLLYAVVVTCQVLGPLVVLCPAAWSGQLAQQTALARGYWFLPGFLALFAGPLAESWSLPVGTVLMGCGTIHMALMWVVLRGERQDLRSSTAWCSASLAAIVGTIPEVPIVLPAAAVFFGWGLAFALAMRRLPMPSA